MLETFQTPVLPINIIVEIEITYPVLTIYLTPVLIVFPHAFGLSKGYHHTFSMQLSPSKLHVLPNMCLIALPVTVISNQKLNVRVEWVAPLIYFFGGGVHCSNVGSVTGFPDIHFRVFHSSSR